MLLSTFRPSFTTKSRMDETTTMEHDQSQSPVDVEETLVASSIETQEEIGSVMVMDSRTYETMRFGYTATTTLAQFKRSIRRDLFQQQKHDDDDRQQQNDPSSSSSRHVDGHLQLFWLGKELKEGCSWHTVGMIDEEHVVLMKDLDFFGNNMFDVDSLSSRTLAAAERPVMHAHYQAPAALEWSSNNGLEDEGE